MIRILDSLKITDTNATYNIIYENGRANIQGKFINIFFEYAWQLETDNICSNCFEVQKNINTYSAFVLKLRIPLDENNSDKPMHNVDYHFSAAKVIVALITDYIDSDNCVRNGIKQPFYTPTESTVKDVKALLTENETAEEKPKEDTKKVDMRKCFADIYSAIFESDFAYCDPKDKGNLLQC